jgi:hypothetical protein
VHVNLTHLRYIDAACAAVVVAAARSLPSARRMIVTCGGLVGKVLDLAGAREVAELRVNDVHGTR